MRVLTFASVSRTAHFAADLVAAAVVEKPDLVLGLPTGKTVIPLYGELASRHSRGEIELSQARAFNLDELLLPRAHVGSFRHFMERHGWAAIGLDPGRCSIPDPEADPAAECERYQSALVAAGGFDLAILGVGADGHVAYNLPGPPRETTHLVELDDALAESLAVPSGSRPLRAITIGLGALRSAGRLLMLATGPEKAAAIRALVEGPADPRWPCSLLRDHPHFDLLLGPGLAALAGSEE
jgi:glucosamine-6-phosphate deaminase